MSWFSVVQHGKSLWDQHAFAKSIFTGNIVSDFIFQKGIKNNCVHRVIRDAVSEVFATIAAPKLFPYSKKIATTVLKHSLNREKVLHLGGRLKQNLTPHLTPQGFIKAGKTSFDVLKNFTGNYLRNNPFGPIEVLIAAHQPSNIASKVTALIKFVYQYYPSDEAKEIAKNLIKFEVSLATHRAMVSTLRPICEQAVRAGMVSATKAVGSGVYDFSVKKIVSLTAMPLIYNGILTALEWSGKHYVNSIIASDLSTLAVSAQETVSPNALLWGLATVNALDMVYIFWNALRSSSKQPQEEDIDKEEVRSLALKYAQAPIAKKLQENAFFITAGISQDQGQIDTIATMLINETIELYWKDLKSQKALGLPLLS